MCGEGELCADGKNAIEQLGERGEGTKKRKEWRWGTVFVRIK